MFKKFNSKLFIKILFILNLKIFVSFTENIDSIKTELNLTVTSSSGKNYLITAPKLLGIFADGVNDSTNILNNNQYSVDIDIINQDRNESQSKNSSVFTINKISENTVRVPQNVLNTSESSGEYLDRFNEQSLEPTEATVYQKPNRCKHLKFFDSTENYDNEVNCVLGSDSDPFQSSYSLNTSWSYYAQTGLDLDYWYFHIPEQTKEEQYIANTSYIAIAVNFPTKLQSVGKVLIIDEGNDQILYSYYCLNDDTENACDSKPKDFVSDSNKVRVEFAVLRNLNSHGIPMIPHWTAHKGKLIDGEVREGTRQISSLQFQMNITYFEIEFVENNDIILKPDNGDSDLIRETPYLQNSIVTYRLMPLTDQKETKIGIEIKITLLNIDIDAGDFVLIGPGNLPTHRELSKAQIIAQNVTENDPPKKVWVNADSAYIRLVTHNSDNSNRKPGIAMKFEWIPANTTLVAIKDEQDSDIIKNSAIQICILDYGCQHFLNAMQDDFKEELVHIANDFLFNKDDDNKEEETKRLVSQKSIYFLGKGEDGVYDQHSERNKLYCQLNMAITSAFNKQWPLVSHNTLKYLFFRGSEYRDMHSFGKIRVTDCTRGSISFLKMILPIIVILIVSIILLFIAWRYQYNNWNQMQKRENSKYVTAPTGDQNEDVLYAKDNPIFIDDENNLQTNKGKANNINKMDSVDGRPVEHRPLGKELSYGSNASEQGLRKLSSVKESKESPEFVKNLWTTPGTSRQQNDYIIDDSMLSEDISDDIYGPNHATVDNNQKANTYSKSSGDTLTAQIPITGKNGTQHESLSRFPRSALRRPTLDFSENVENSEPKPEEVPTNPFRRPSKVQFELPVVADKQQNSSIEY